MRCIEYHLTVTGTKLYPIMTKVKEVLQYDKLKIYETFSGSKFELFNKKPKQAFTKR